jgi:hypothetical protein
MGRVKVGVSDEQRQALGEDGALKRRTCSKGKGGVAERRWRFGCRDCAPAGADGGSGLSHSASTRRGWHRRPSRAPKGRSQGPRGPAGGSRAPRTACDVAARLPVVAAGPPGCWVRPCDSQADRAGRVAQARAEAAPGSNLQGQSRREVRREGDRRGPPVPQSAGNAVVLSVDEKTSIQALERTQLPLPLRRGRPLGTRTTTSATASWICTPRWRWRPGRSRTS